MNNSIISVKASDNKVPTSIQKLNIVCQLVRNKKALHASEYLSFCKKKASKYIRSVLNSAIANGQNNYSLDINRLVISEIVLGKSISLKRTMSRAKGRSSRIIRPRSKITVILREKN